jgi:hypothetical protein
VDITIYQTISLIVVGLAIIVAIIIALKAQKRTPHLERYHISGRQVYVSGEFSSQMELDLRLPYRRFKQLYPDSKLTYEEYKKLQMKTAFRRSMSSQDNKRMVR